MTDLAVRKELTLTRKEKPTHSNFKDIENQKFGKLTVVEFAETNERGDAFWWCQCECDRKIIKVKGSNLRNGNTKSCGCHQKQQVSLSNKLHGMSGTPEYQSYRDAKVRCNDPNFKQYKDYGGRGIKFLFNSFEEFYRELGDRPSKNHSLERINNNGNYEVGNVKWAIRLEQMKNTRINRFIDYKGEIKCLIEWSKIYKISSTTLLYRLKNNWCSDCLFSNPPSKCNHKL